MANYDFCDLVRDGISSNHYGVLDISSSPPREALELIWPTM
jgi:hypothetical protein